MPVRQFPPFNTAGTAPASGSLVLEFHTRGSDTYRVTQVTAEMPAAAGASCALRRNGALISPLVATGDAASGDPPIWVGPGDVMTVEWTGAPIGAVGKMVVIYDLGG